MKKDARYLIVKDIYVEERDMTIKHGGLVTRTHGCYYLDGGLLDRYFQDQFDRLIDYETENGFKYLKKLY